MPHATTRTLARLLALLGATLSALLLLGVAQAAEAPEGAAQGVATATAAEARCSMTRSILPRTS